MLSSSRLTRRGSGVYNSLGIWFWCLVTVSPPCLPRGGRGINKLEECVGVGNRAGEELPWSRSSHGAMGRSYSLTPGKYRTQKSTTQDFLVSGAISDLGLGSALGTVESAQPEDGSSVCVTCGRV